MRHILLTFLTAACLTTMCVGQTVQIVIVGSIAGTDSLPVNVSINWQDTAGPQSQSVITDVNGDFNATIISPAPLDTINGFISFLNCQANQNVQSFSVVGPDTIYYSKNYCTPQVSVYLATFDNAYGAPINLLMSENSGPYVPIPNISNNAAVEYYFMAADSFGTVSFSYINCCGDTVFTPTYPYSLNSSAINDTIAYCPSAPCGLDTLHLNGTISDLNGVPLALIIYYYGVGFSAVDSVYTDSLGVYSYDAVFLITEAPYSYDIQFIDCNGAIVDSGELGGYNSSAIVINDASYCPPTSCSGVLNGGVISGPVNVGIGVPFTLDVTGSTVATGLEHQWQISTSVTGPWTDITGATNTAYTDSAFGFSTVCYRRRIVCGVATDTSYTNTHCISAITCLGNSPQLIPTITPVGGLFGFYTVTVNATGGTAPYTYSWSTGVTGTDSLILSDGIYCATVTDANGCSDDSCFIVGNASLNPVIVNVQLTDVNDSVPITISADSMITSVTAFTDINGFFSDTVYVTSSSTNFYLTFSDCTGAPQTVEGFYSPATMSVDFTADFCPDTVDIVTVNVQLQNTFGPVQVFIQGDSVSTNFYTNASGFGTAYIPVVFPSSPVTISFIDCDSALEDTVLFPNPVNLVINYNGVYCDSIPASQYVTVYGQLLNADSTFTTVELYSDADYVFDTVDINGAFTAQLVVNTTDSINLEFYDCNGEFFYGTYPIVNNEVYITEDYCPPIDTCAALYTTTYDATNNAFILEMDSATQSIAYDYFWDFGDGTSSVDQFPTHVYTVSALYDVCLYLSDSNGTFCFYCHTIGVDSLGNIVTRQDGNGFTINVVPFGFLANPELPEQSFDLYPNPVDDESTIKLYSDEARIYIISVYNAVGQRVYALKADVNKGYNYVHVPMKNLVPGMYLMSVDFGNKTVSRRFAK